MVAGLLLLGALVYGASWLLGKVLQRFFKWVADGLEQTR